MMLERETRETSVKVALSTTDPTIAVDTTEPFLTHMMETLARYSGLGLRLEARGDLRHHLIEDVAITLGTALLDLVPAHAVRYGHRVLPMDDALVAVALDVGGRPFYRGPLPSRLWDHWMRSFADHARCTLHVVVERGTDRHHVVEAAFKGLGLALRDALADGGVVFSTKGGVAWRRHGSA
ncbi:MAG: imidazoleglycerol-phosphate dehydratase [Gemmatimonadaceae bacterium]|nr:imidazoleglycerol-phosphate dehydratase [Gemmatimonadaceae bacterium]